MAKISTYPSAEEPLLLSDRLIGTEAIRTIPSPTPLATKNFSLGELLLLFSDNFPAASLQAVLDTGNSATQNITLVGTIDTTLIKPDNIEDTTGSQGLTFQFLSKGTSSINWVDLPIDNLQAVLNAGNTATQNITLVGNITSTKIIPGNIQDETSVLGTTGQVLSKTATGIKWITNPASYTAGLADVLSVGNTSTLDANIGGLGLYDLEGFSYATITVFDHGFTFKDYIGETSISFEQGSLNIHKLNSIAGSLSTNLLTVSRGYYLPDAAGTIALTSDIPAPITLTTLGTSGPATLISNVLNIPQYSGGALYTFSSPLVDTAGIITINQSGIITDGYLSFIDWNTFNDKQDNLSGTGFVKSTAGIISYDTNSYYLSSNPSGFITSSALTPYLLSTIAASTYYPIPTGTISQYIRGDGTFATFPNIPTFTPSAMTKVDDTNVTLTLGGTPSTSLLQDVSLTLGWTGTLADSRIASAAIWNAKQNAITLTTIGSSGAATLIGSTLNIPDYASGISGTIPHATASGTDTYTATVAGIASYADGDAYLIRFTNGNTTVCTLNINALGAVPLYRNNDGQLIGGDIWNGGEMLCTYNSTLNIFQCIGTSPNSLFAYITNADSVAITKGQPVYAFGGTGDRMTVKRAFNTSDAGSAKTIGVVVTSSIAVNQKGIIIVQGLLDGLSILPTATWADGDTVYLGNTAGSITNIKPYAPNHLVYLGTVTTASNGSAGRWYVRVQNGYELDELHNVQAQSPTLKDTLWYDNTVSPAQWKTASISTILGYTPQGALTLTTTGTSGPATLIGATLNIPQYGGGGGGSTPVKLTSQILTAASWTLVGSYYTYAFSNVNVTTTCDVSVTPQNASYLTAYNAQVLPYVGVAAGVATFYSQFPPDANMTVDIVITQTI